MEWEASVLLNVGRAGAFYNYSLNIYNIKIIIFQRSFENREAREIHQLSCTRVYYARGGDGKVGGFHKNKSAINNAIQLYTYRFDESETINVDKLRTVVTSDALKLLTELSLAFSSDIN